MLSWKVVDGVLGEQEVSVLNEEMQMKLREIELKGHHLQQQKEILEQRQVRPSFLSTGLPVPGQMEWSFCSATAL